MRPAGFGPAIAPWELGVPYPLNSKNLIPGKQAGSDSSAGKPFAMKEGFPVSLSSGLLFRRHITHRAAFFEQFQRFDSQCLGLFVHLAANFHVVANALHRGVLVRNRQETFLIGVNE